ncbi:M15 family metallopeptidase [Ruminococcus sp.]|uniref:M15 family metallopeptidase n=1 Tax=Ruminococcus sp. TaxID=41978 RepID=UPI0025D2D507|nr:M15 family metallopeptidase [Ruminococcus sp.]MBQ8967167.1 M15 family metallopeptidase [Ruminococcus sp.]
MRRSMRFAAACTAICLLLAGCGDKNKNTENKADTQQTTQTEAGDAFATADEDMLTTSDDETTTEDETHSIDYMALVNKLNPLPENWENELETVHCTNSLGDDVEVEKKAYDAYLELKAELEEEGIYVDLDSARRSVADQERIMADFTEQYGEDYAIKTVATPGFSEHHTGLALDLYLNVYGEDIYLNEDMVQYPEIWSAIHEKLAEHGFILRYPEGKEHITGYGYEPWHIRYIDDADAAEKIMSEGLTLEEYLGAVNSAELKEDLGTSKLFSEEELEEAAVQVKCKFATFEGCELHSLRYAGDEFTTKENLAIMKEFDNTTNYAEVVEFLTDFHTPKEGSQVFDPDTEMKDYRWWLGREKDGGWQIIIWEK